MPSFSVAVLAGGQSRRMGRDKARLQLGGAALIERVLAVARALDAPCFLVIRQAGDFADLGVPSCLDQYPGSGPLGGLCTALKHSSACAVLLLACDLPFLTPDFLRFLAAQGTAHQALIPRSDDGLQPLCALYARSCLPAIERALDRNELRMTSFHAEVSVRVLEPQEWQPFDPHGLLFSNLNTPEEYQRAQELLGRQEGQVFPRAPGQNSVNFPLSSRGG